MFKIILSVLLLQVAATIAECDNQEIVTTRVTDIQDMFGDWSDVYAWYTEPTFRSMARSECFRVSMEPVTVAEVAAKKAECQNSNTAFNYDNVFAKIVVHQPNAADRFITLDGVDTYIQQNCDWVVKAEARKVNANYVLIVYPEYDVAELLSRTNPSDEEVVCIARNIDVMKGKSGLKLCA